mmetsp:Transcript_78241/g.162460  ORF Transcript_78241/g.162460 Transcript_78241/m.162460 type:complete len:281 (+) Transcript_78241:254-1096(+)
MLPERVIHGQGPCQRRRQPGLIPSSYRRGEPHDDRRRIHEGDCIQYTTEKAWRKPKRSSTKHLHLELGLLHLVNSFGRAVIPAGRPPGWAGRRFPGYLGAIGGRRALTGMGLERGLQNGPFAEERDRKLGGGVSRPHRYHEPARAHQQRQRSWCNGRPTMPEHRSLGLHPGVGPERAEHHLQLAVRDELPLRQPNRRGPSLLRPPQPRGPRYRLPLPSFLEQRRHGQSPRDLERGLEERLDYSSKQWGGWTSRLEHSFQSQGQGRKQAWLCHPGQRALRL